MKLMLLASFIAVPAIIFMSCHSTQQIRDRNLTKATDCPFQQMNWMKVTTTYDKSKVADIAFKIGAAANADAEQLKKVASANGGVGFNDSLAKAIREITKDSVEVSQEFFQTYENRRASLCDNWTLMQMPDTKKDTSFLHRLQDQYFQISNTFRQVGEDEQKKNR